MAGKRSSPNGVPLLAWKRKRLKKDRPPDSGREDSEQAAKFREEQRKPPNPEGMTARKAQAVERWWGMMESKPFPTRG